MNAEHVQIGDVAERTGLSLRTIRWYEQVRLVPPSARTAGGFRLYTEQDIARLELVKRMKPLEFSLEEMRHLLDTVDQLDDPATPAAARAELHTRLAMFRELAEQRVGAPSWRTPSCSPRAWPSTAVRRAAAAGDGCGTTSTSKEDSVTMFRVRAVDGSTRSVTAGRDVVSVPQVLFQSPGSTGWVTVDESPLASVARVERRFNEPDGRVRWVDETDVNAAAEAARPEPGLASEPAPDDTPAPGPAAAPAAQGAEAAAREPRVAPAAPPAVSARDVRCPRCGEHEELSGRRAQGEILLTCHTGGYDGPRVAGRTCETCGGGDVVERPKALVERSRGTQLSVVGYTTAVLCRTCDADALAAALAHGGAILPEDLPTVDPQTLREMGRSKQGPRRPTP